MGYDDLDRALLRAWHRAHDKAKDEPTHLVKILKRRGMATYARPLRSWSLVLRASDKRIADDHSLGLVRMDGAGIRRLCSPVVIRYPGVSLDDAARLFGVNRTTIARWASPTDEEGKPVCTWWQAVQRQMAAAGNDAVFGKPGTHGVTGARLMLEHEVNRANIKRSTTRVWTPGFHGLDPGGEVYSADWGELRVGLADRVPERFNQQLQRVDRRLGKARTDAKGPAARVMQWRCPVLDGGCGRRVYKLYLPMPYWTMVSALGGRVDPPVDAGLAGVFLCQRCAGLIYESAERTSSPGKRISGMRRQVDDWDRFIKRISGGAFVGRAIDRCLGG